MTKIKHRPVLNIDKVCKHYSKKDGVPVKYVCTSTIDGGLEAMDIFYRGTPHPEFGNKYFGLYFNLSDSLMITNADVIEDLDFGMISDKDGEYHYSSHRHDYIAMNDKVIDGGRAYVRGYGYDMFKVIDGEFVQKEYSDG